MVTCVSKVTWGKCSQICSSVVPVRVCRRRRVVSAGSLSRSVMVTSDFSLSFSLLMCTLSTTVHPLPGPDFVSCWAIGELLGFVPGGAFCGVLGVMLISVLIRALGGVPGGVFSDVLGGVLSGSLGDMPDDVVGDTLSATVLLRLSGHGALVVSVSFVMVDGVCGCGVLGGVQGDTLGGALGGAVGGSLGGTPGDTLDYGDAHDDTSGDVLGDALNDDLGVPSSFWCVVCRCGSVCGYVCVACVCVRAEYSVCTRFCVFGVSPGGGGTIYYASGWLPAVCVSYFGATRLYLFFDFGI